MGSGRLLPIALVACTDVRSDLLHPPALTTTGGARPGSNVLVLVVDDLGTDKVSAYAEHPDAPHTPVIDGLAARGVLFRNAWAHPVCSPTRATILTGRLPRRHGVGSNVAGTIELSLDEVLLPELLEPAGYRSIAAGKWHLSTSSSATGLHHPLQSGFHRFRGSIGNLVDEALVDEREEGYRHWEHVVDGVVEEEGAYAVTVDVDDTLELLAEVGEPFFAWVGLHGVHGPLEAPPVGLARVHGKDDPSLYDAMVRATDAELGRLLDALGADVTSRTDVIVVADNGTNPEAVRVPLSPHHAKNSPFEGGINVPLVIAGPSVARRGEEELALVHVADLFATVAGIAGTGTDAPMLHDVVLDSTSLLPLLGDAGATPPHEQVHSEKFAGTGLPGDWRMSRDGSFKVIETLPAAPLLFDLRGRFDDGPPLRPEDLDPAEVEQALALLDAHEDFFDELTR